jgi:NitT/TauT family transport system substrate-binding protein
LTSVGSVRQSSSKDSFGVFRVLEDDSMGQNGYSYRRRSIRRPYLALLGAISLVVAGCTTGQEPSAPAGQSAGASAAEPSQAAEPVSVRFRLAWTIGGEDAPWVMGIEKGFFADEGLDVEFQEGSGSGESVQLAGAGTVDIANADTPPVMLGIEQGVPVKMVFNQTPTSGFILQWVKGRTPDLVSPADLEGLTIVVHQGSGEAAMLPFLLESNGLSEEDVTIVQAPPPTGAYVALVQEQADVRLGLWTSITEIEELDPSLAFDHLLLNDFGIDMQAHGLIVNLDFLAENPEAVAAFVRAAQRSWQYVLESEEHEAEALAITEELYPEAVSGDALAIQLRGTLENLRSGANTNMPVGWMDQTNWEETQELVQVLFPEESEPLPIDEYYTNEFISEDFPFPAS